MTFNQSYRDLDSRYPDESRFLTTVIQWLLISIEAWKFAFTVFLCMGTYLKHEFWNIFTQWVIICMYWFYSRFLPDFFQRWLWNYLIHIFSLNFISCLSEWFNKLIEMSNWEKILNFIAKINPNKISSILAVVWLRFCRQ